MPLSPPEFLKAALSRPVAVFGGGVSGEGVLALLSALSAQGKIYDAKAAKGVEFTAAAAKQHRLVIFSPGFAPEHPWFKRAKAADAICLGELDFASLFWRESLAETVSCTTAARIAGWRLAAMPMPMRLPQTCTPHLARRLSIASGTASAKSG